MGQYFHIVNPAKAQYVSAGTFEENNNASGVMRGFHANALALLVCKVDEAMSPPPELAGSWFGDKVYVVGNDYGKADAYGIKTSTLGDPDRNLYFLALEEFEDVSLKAIAMMCEWDDYWAERFVEDCVEGRPGMLICLGNTVFTIGCEPLRSELEKRLGKDWGMQYRSAWLTHGIRPVEAIGQWKNAPPVVKEWVKNKVK